MSPDRDREDRGVVCQTIDHLRLGLLSGQLVTRRLSGNQLLLGPTQFPVLERSSLMPTPDTEACRSPSLNGSSISHRHENIINAPQKQLSSRLRRSHPSIPLTITL